MTPSELSATAVRRFRHFLRHADAAPLDAARITELAREWRAARPRLGKDLAHFEAFLEQLAEHLENHG